MALQKFSVAEAVGLLTARGTDDEEELSEDEMIGDFVTVGGESVVLSSEMLSRVPAMTVAPLASELDSLLLGEEDDDVVEEGGDCGEGSAAIGHGNTSGKDISDTAPFVFNWTEAPANSIEPELPEFREPTGPSSEAKLAKTPLECFQLFFVPALVSILMTQTNLYADQCRATGVPSPSNLWGAVSMEEMLAFLGMHIAMGIVSLPSLHDFWSTEPILQHQWFSSVMSRDRFKQIVRYFHCCDSSHCIPRGEEGHDPLYKVRGVIEILSRNFKDHFKPGRELSFD